MEASRMHFPAAEAQVSAAESMVEAGSMAEAATLEAEEGTDEHPASDADNWTGGDGNDA
jgi:hypothetical protein